MVYKSYYNNCFIFRKRKRNQSHKVRLCRSKKRLFHADSATKSNEVQVETGEANTSGAVIPSPNVMERYVGLYYKPIYY